MEFKLLKEEQWAEIKSIYMEAFPKRERKPFFTLKRSVKKEKSSNYDCFGGKSDSGICCFDSL